MIFLFLQAPVNVTGLRLGLSGVFTLQIVSFLYDRPAAPEILGISARADLQYEQARSVIDNG